MIYSERKGGEKLEVGRFFLGRKGREIELFTFKCYWAAYIHLIAMGHVVVRKAPGT